MHFSVDQPIEVTPEQAQGALVDPEFYGALGQMPAISAPDVLEHHREDGQVLLRLRYRFTGSLAPPARAALDPAKLTWVQESTADLVSRVTRLRMVPEHYGQRLSFEGWYRLDDDGGRTVQHFEAELRVRWPLVGGLVERAIVSGLRQHLGAEARILEQWVAERGDRS